MNIIYTNKQLKKGARNEDGERKQEEPSLFESINCVFQCCEHLLKVSS